MPESTWVLTTSAGTNTKAYYIHRRNSSGDHSQDYYRNGAPAPVPDSPGAQSEIEYLLALVLLLPLSSTNNETIVCITLSILMLNPYEFTGLTDMDKNNPDYPPGSEPWFENASSIEASRMSNDETTKRCREFSGPSHSQRFCCTPLLRPTGVLRN